MGHAAFSQLAKPIQRILWDLRWEELRPIQVQAIEKVLGGTGDLIISAPTAGGKTEAAFLPILSYIAEQPGTSVRALYVGPLKALINDQFQRLETLCEHAEIPVHRWHGDVSGGAKDRLVKQPSGVLLITPESIESLMINRSGQLPRLFADLRFVVIDEIHAFMGTERGTHLRSLLYRLERHAKEPVRLLGLSATIGDLEQTARWFGPERAPHVQVIRDAAAQRSIRFRIEAAVEPAGADEDSVVAERELARRMLKVFAGSTNLIFANRREDVELFADLLNEEARREGIPPCFLVHHGALSKEIREQTELEMQSSRPTTAVCSATLELGIDVGRVKTVGQIGPPWSVASLIQRLGRSGRRDDEPSIMRLYIPIRTPEPDAELPDKLHFDLHQAIALTELMLEKWVEPTVAEPFDLSTLLQQVLSVVVETGGCRAATLYSRLIEAGAFRSIDKDTLLELLKSMGAADLIEQTSDGLLILGLAGEKLVKRYDFYSAFATPETFQVLHGSELIGELQVECLPAPEDRLLLGGRRWRCVTIDLEHQAILVEPAKGSKPPKFLGGGGEIHPRVRQKMRDVLLGDQSFTYLDDIAAGLLADARQVAHHAGLNESDFVPCGRGCYWFPWTGTRILRTVAAILRASGIEVVQWSQHPYLWLGMPTDDVRLKLSELIDNLPSSKSVLDMAGALWSRKYDWYLSPLLLEQSALLNLIDVEGATRVLRSHAAYGDAPPAGGGPELVSS